MEKSSSGGLDNIGDRVKIFDVATTTPGDDVRTRSGDSQGKLPNVVADAGPMDDERATMVGRAAQAPTIADRHRLVGVCRRQRGNDLIRGMRPEVPPRLLVSRGYNC